MLTTYSFTLTLPEFSDISGGLEEKIYGKLSDVLLSSSCGVVSLDFDREAHSLPEAVESAIRDLMSLGLKVSW